MNMFLRNLKTLTILLFVSGCISTSQINRAQTSVDLFWQGQNEKFMKHEGSRTYRATPRQAFIAARVALSHLGMVIDKQDPGTGYLLASAPAPVPLTSEEWEEVKKQDTAAMQELIVEELGVLGYAKELDPSYKDVLLNVLIAEKNGGSSVALSFRLLNKKHEEASGGRLRTQVPPTAVRIGVKKVWRTLEDELGPLSAAPLERPAPPPPYFERPGGNPKRNFSNPAPAPAPFSVAKSSSVRKQACANVGSQSGKSIDTIKRNLLLKAKKLALSELFGEVVSSRSRVYNFSLDFDVLSTESFGIVRTKGSPRYFNGKSLGEICVEGEFFLTSADLKKLTPKTVRQENVCFSDESLSYLNLKRRLRARAIHVLLTKTSPSLTTVDSRGLASLIRNLDLTNERHFVATSAICADASADIVPLEIEAYVKWRRKSG
jgi:hypothetical protein